MAAGIAHELNQPLSAIANFTRGCIRRLQSGAGTQAELIHAMESAASQAERASQVIQHIMRLARKRESRRSTVRINDLVREVASFIEFEIRESQISVQLDLPESLPPIICGRRMLRRQY